MWADRGMGPVKDSLPRAYLESLLVSLHLVCVAVLQLAGVVVMLCEVSCAVLQPAAAAAVRHD